MINTLHVCPNWCFSVFENLSTVHRKVCGDGVYSLYVLLGRGRGRWHNIPALWCLSGTRACRQDNWSPGVDEVHMVPWWCPKIGNLGYLRCEVACWKSPEEILRERKCHLWWPLCGESFVMWWDLWQCASSQCLAPRSFTSNIHPPNQDGAFEKEGRGFWMVKQLDLQGMRTRQGSEEKFWHIEAPGYSSEIPPLPINTCYISLIFLVLSKSLALYFTQSGVKEANQISLILRLKNVLSEEALRPTTCDDIYENEGLNHAARAE